MKMHKFRELRQQNPWILRILGFDHLLIQNEFEAETRAQAESQLRDFVRQKLEYVEFRPFETLDLDTIRNDGQDTLEHRLVIDPYFDGDQNRWYDEHFEIFWHLADRAGHPEEVNWMSITTKIEEVKRWWMEHIKDTPELLMFDRVVKVTSEGVVGCVAPTKVSVDIYPFQPQNRWAFWPPAPPKEPLTYREFRDLEATAAYVSGCPMPPIIPPDRALMFA